MLKKLVLAVMIASSTLVAVPQAASAAAVRGDECELNCFWTTIYGDNGEVLGGYWTCSGIYMDCLSGE
ncbi:hypothetical protein GCM10009422_23560 [Brevundimonas kwangchunensis]|uniref:Uncharacterized protein n=1 Tax=Brevundimonas kwangchunensis TaxID=322163 RepID=A0ABN1H185_9CAUL